MVSIAAVSMCSSRRFDQFSRMRPRPFSARLYVSLQWSWRAVRPGQASTRWFKLSAERIAFGGTRVGFDSARVLRRGGYRLSPPPAASNNRAAANEFPVRFVRRRLAPRPRDPVEDRLVPRRLAPACTSIVGVTPTPSRRSPSTSTSSTARSNKPPPIRNAVAARTAPSVRVPITGPSRVFLEAIGEDFLAAASAAHRPA